MSPDNSKKEFYEYQEGEPGPFNRKKVHTVIIATNEVMVYLASDHSIQWITGEEYDYPDGFGEVNAAVVRLEALTETVLDRKTLNASRTMLAEALARALDDRDIQLAQTQITKAELFITSRAIERQRSVILSVEFLSVAVLLLFAAVVFAVARNNPDISGLWTIHFFSLAVMWGGAGALFSFVTRLSTRQSVSIDHFGDGWIHALEGIARIIVGGSGAAVVAAAMKAQLVGTLGIPETAGSIPETRLYLTIVLCFLAGASERFVPNFLERLEGKAEPPAPPEQPKPVEEPKPEKKGKSKNGK
jgi:hypothetical protein